MNTQQQVIALAKQQVAQGAALSGVVESLLTSYQMAFNNATMARASIQSHLGVFDEAIQGSDGFSFPLNNEHIVASSSRLATAITQMAETVIVLRSVLSQAGVQLPE